MQIRIPSKHLIRHATHQKSEYLYNIHEKFVQFSPPYSTLVQTIIVTIRINTPFHHTSVIFLLPIFAYYHPNNLPLPPAFIEFRLRERTKELRSLVRADTVLISRFSLKVWPVITGNTITDSLLQVEVSDGDTCNQNDKLFNPPSLIP